MKIAIGSDEKTHLTDFVIEELKKRGYEVGLIGALVNEEMEWKWSEIGELVAEKVASGEYEQGILFCWTGTGVSIVANKIPGIRAALCVDAETAKGAKKWNDANVLVMSLRLTSENVAKEILDAWFSSKFEGEEERLIKVKEIEQKYSKS